MGISIESRYEGKEKYKTVYSSSTIVVYILTTWSRVCLKCISCVSMGSTVSMDEHARVV